jgi:hypothetical protein
MPQRNLAVELLRKLLSGEIQTRRKKECRAGSLFCRDAGRVDPPVSKPGH